MTSTTPTAAAQWADALSQWAIPRHILDAAPRDPYVFDQATFAAPPPGTRQRSGSTLLAAEALEPGGSVLDVGCGGGAAAFALLPEAELVIGNDRQQDMLDLFAQTAAARGVRCEVYLGDWLMVQSQVPTADVVVCNNVLYNVADITAFVAALDRHARARVVIEVTQRHPQHVRAPLWKHFWGLERPGLPTAEMACDAVREAGFDARLEHTVATPRADREPLHTQAPLWCRQLCLPPDREAEMAELLRTFSFPSERATIWWDVSRSRADSSTAS